MKVISHPPAAPTMDDLERYWTETLVPFTQTFGIPADLVRGTPVPHTTGEVRIPVAREVSDRVLAAARGRPVSSLAIVIAAAQVVLHRQNGGAAVSVLTPVARSESGEGGINRWLVVKTAVDPDAPANVFVDTVGEALAAAFAHQEFPFVRMLELAGKAWPAARAPLSDVAVVFDGVSRMDVLHDVQSDIAIIGAVRDGSLSLSIRYQVHLFVEETVTAFGRVLVRVIDRLLAAHAPRVREVELTDGHDEHERGLALRRGEDRGLPRRRVEALVADVARAFPQRVAFTHESAQLTYGELVARARGLAAALHAAGVRPGDRVAVALDPGLRLPVALLGVLFCGAAFVPLDARHPLARLRKIIDRVQPAVLLAEDRLREPCGAFVTVLEWDAGCAIAGDEPAAEVGDDEALAYVMFTSGSTGEPSGVAVSHRSLVNYLLWAQAQYLGSTQPTFALYTSIAFDLTLTSIFLPLVSGCATVVFTQPDGVLDMGAVLGDARVNVVKATPSHLRLLHLQRLPTTAVRVVIVGGEAFDWDLAAALQTALGPDAAIFNEYGPTESTIACSAHRFVDGHRRSTVPVGDPIWNAGMYVLDDDLRPVPMYMPGQLWIAGRPLAQGYFGDPERTRDRFIEDPFRPGHRMYATGDRVRCGPGGSLYFLGRLDDQVKFNGMRIELEELRSALARVPRVRDAVVRLLDDGAGNKLLVAYYVARQDIDISLLRASLLEQLPEEMLPNLFTRVPRLPLTLNGKVDVDRLPTVEDVRARAPQTFIGPRTETERTVASAWAEVLGVPEISVHSNFFELGGHSLLASQVAWRISDSLGVEMPLRLLFDAPTIGQLSDLLDKRRAAAAAPVSLS